MALISKIQCYTNVSHLRPVISVMSVETGWSGRSLCWLTTTRINATIISYNVVMMRIHAWQCCVRSAYNWTLVSGRTSSTRQSIMSLQNMTLQNEIFFFNFLSSAHNYYCWNQNVTGSVSLTILTLSPFSPGGPWGPMSPYMVHGGTGTVCK